MGKLVDENMGLVPFIINKYLSGFHTLREDLVQVGYEAMVMAEKKFDEKRGFKFTSLAKHYILGYCYSFINKHSKTVSGNQKNTRNLNKATREYEESLHGEGVDAIDKIAEKYNVDKYDILGKNIVVDDISVVADSYSSMTQLELDEYIKTELDNLSSKERYIIRYYYGYNVPPVEPHVLAAMFDTDVNEIEKIRKTARKKL